MTNRYAFCDQSLSACKQSDGIKEIGVAFPVYKFQFNSRAYTAFSVCDKKNVPLLKRNDVATSNSFRR